MAAGWVTGSMAAVITGGTGLARRSRRPPHRPKTGIPPKHLSVLAAPAPPNSRCCPRGAICLSAKASHDRAAACSATLGNFPTSLLKGAGISANASEASAQARCDNTATNSLSRTTLSVSSLGASGVPACGGPSATTPTAAGRIARNCPHVIMPRSTMSSDGAAEGGAS